MSAPALHTADGNVNNLPVQPTPFIGREREVAEACALLLRDDARVVTLTGPGGTGKTRLAVQVAGQLLPHFEHGSFFVALAPITDPALVPTTVAQALGVMESADRPLIDTLKAHLRDKHLLLVLDNFEQILDAAEIVGDMLSACPKLRVLVTSRSRLRLRSEREFPVPPLSMPDRGRMPSAEGMTQYEAVRLFIDRAVALRPDFSVTNDNAPAVAEICARLDGLPLAIELAAARIKILSPDAMLARMQNRLRLLVGGGRDLPARQQTLRAAIEWSYDLLDEDERTLFRGLSVFAGSCSLDAIEAVCAAMPSLALDPIDGTASLMDKNLMRQASVPTSDTRFMMLETIQEYAREKLQESGEADEVYLAHAQFFLDFAEQAEAQLRGPKQVEWLNRLEVEHDNFRSALKWSIEQGKTEIALRLSAALVQFWKVHGHLTEGRTWLEGALASAAADSVGPSASSRAKALMAVGTLAVPQGDYVRARSALKESLDLFKTLGDKGNIAVVLRNLGYEARLQGDNSLAYDYLQEGLAIAREVGERLDIAAFLGDLGIMAQTLGDLDAARDYYEESLAIRRALRDKRGIAMQLVNLGELARNQGQYEQAGALYEEGLALAVELGDRWGVAMVQHNLGHVAFHRYQYRQAFDLFAESLRAFYDMRKRWDIAYCLSALGGVFGAVREPKRAAVLFSAAQVLFNTISSHLDPADQVDYERNLASTKAQLSPEEWERAWTVGQYMTLDEAVAYALEQPPQEPTISGPLVRGRGTAPLDPMTTGPLNRDALNTGPLSTSILTTGPLGDYPHGLSEREVEVLRLVAVGLTDTQVAEQLVISPRTVHRHLSSIYSKLGVTTRTAAARLAAEYNLV